MNCRVRLQHFMPKNYLLEELGLKDDVMVYLQKTAQVPPVPLKFNKNQIKLVMLPLCCCV